MDKDGNRSKLSVPLKRTIPIAPSPRGVEMAAINFDSTFAGTMAKANGNADELKTLAAEVDAKLTAVANVLNAKSGKQKVSIQVPAGVKVDTWTYDGQTYAGSGWNGRLFDLFKE